MPLQTLAIFFLGMLAAGGLAYVFIYPILSGEKQAEKRQAVVSSKDGLVSHQAEHGMFVPPEIPMFVELFRKKVADWDLSDETDVVPLGDRFWAIGEMNVYGN